MPPSVTRQLGGTGGSCGVVPSSIGRDKALRRLLAKPRRRPRTRGRGPKTRRLLEKPKRNIDPLQGLLKEGSKDDLPDFSRDGELDLGAGKTMKAIRLCAGTGDMSSLKVFMNLSFCFC